MTRSNTRRRRKRRRRRTLGIITRQRRGRRITQDKTTTARFWARRSRVKWTTCRGAPPSLTCGRPATTSRVKWTTCRGAPPPLSFFYPRARCRCTCAPRRRRRTSRYDPYNFTLPLSFRRDAIEFWSRRLVCIGSQPLYPHGSAAAILAGEPPSHTNEHQPPAATSNNNNNNPRPAAGETPIEIPVELQGPYWDLTDTLSNLKDPIATLLTPCRI
jgi:hypothetical protein